MSLILVIYLYQNEKSTKEFCILSDIYNSAHFIPELMLF